MNERRQQDIKDYLRQSEAQARILEHIQQARAGMAVTISRAARLFQVTESQLREWEKRGLLHTERPLLSAEGKGSTGHRQYSLAELSKLAIIKDLIDQGYAPADIPTDIEKLWESVAGSFPGTLSERTPISTQPATAAARGTIDERVENMDAQEFWRYFITQALRLSLLLICEDIPNSLAGLVLPLEESNLAGTLQDAGDLAGVGRSLVGWLGKNGSFYLFVTDAPTFKFATDFRLQTLKLDDAQVATGDRVLDNTFVVLQRETRELSLSPELQETVRRLLTLVYQRVDRWEPALAYGMQDWLYETHDLERASRVAGDRMFNALLERVVDLGGKTENGHNRWSFCALLLPDDSNLPIQQQSLTVRAQTRKSPFQIGVTRLSPQDISQASSITLKAFEGSQIVVLAEALPGDSMRNPQQVRVITSTPELIARGQAGKFFQAPSAGEKLHSSLALPIAGEFGISIAVLYIEAETTHAFSPADLRVLRFISRMLEELLMTTRARRQRMVKSRSILEKSAVVDNTFNTFATETDFIMEIDRLLSEVQQNPSIGERGREEISLISVDIDNQSSVAMKQGNRIARNLSQQVGLRIKSNVSSTSSFKVFHISADRYYVLLEGMALDDARKLAQDLLTVLRIGEYRILPLSAVPGSTVLPQNMLELTGVTVHIGVSSYTLAKLDELLKRYEPATAVAYVRTLILAGIDGLLERGKLEGGDCVVTWDRPTWGHKVLPVE